MTFKDETSNMTLHLTEFNHRGHGMFSSEVSELDTSTETHVSFSMDSTFYLKNTSLKLDALIDLDLSNDTYTFKENKGYINQLPITFQGFLRQLDQGQEMEISFENPESDFLTSILRSLQIMPHLNIRIYPNRCAISTLIPL